MTNDVTSHEEVPEREGFAPLRMVGEPAAGMCGPLGCILPPSEAIGAEETVLDTATGSDGVVPDDPHA